MDLLQPRRRSGKSAIAFFCLTAILSLASCIPPREDPFMTVAKKYGSAGYTTLKQYYLDSTGIKIALKGIVLDVDEKKIASLVDSIEKNYFSVMPFRIEKNYGQGGKPDKLAVISVMNQFDLISVLQTRGKDDKVSTASIVQALKAINNNAKIQITGAGIDFVEFKIMDEPQNWTQLARDCAAIAPKIVSMGTGNIKELENELRKYKKGILFWY
jgi:hypothetical protein